MKYYIILFDNAYSTREKSRITLLTRYYTLQLIWLPLFFRIVNTTINLLYWMLSSFNTNNGLQEHQNYVEKIKAISSLYIIPQLNSLNYNYNYPVIELANINMRHHWGIATILGYVGKHTTQTRLVTYRIHTLVQLVRTVHRLKLFPNKFDFTLCCLA